MLRPLLVLHSAFRLHKRRREVVISAPAAERLSAWRGRRRLSAWDSRSGIVLRRQRPSTNRRPLLIFPTVKSRSRPSGDMLWKQRIRRPAAQIAIRLAGFVLWDRSEHLGT